MDTGFSNQKWTFDAHHEEQLLEKTLADMIREANELTAEVARLTKNLDQLRSETQWRRSSAVNRGLRFDD